MSLAQTLEAAWYGEGTAPPWWTRPLSRCYGGVIRLRRWLYRRGWMRSIRLPVPVVVVGNLTVGGTGKTPLTIALATALRDRGFVPGVVSRGYGGRQRDPVLLDRHPDPAVVGDEPCLIHAGGFPVAIGRDRSRAARLLVDTGCDVILADDGLQHYRLDRDLEICVIDGERGFGNGRLLPAGPLREPKLRLVTVDFRVCNGGERTGTVPMRLNGDRALAMQGGAERTLASFAGSRVHAVAAIGHPQRFFDSLRAHGIVPIEHPFPDHHAFVPADLHFAEPLPVLMTDKDAIKCRFADANCWRVPVQADLPERFFDAVALRVREAAGRLGATAPTR